MWWSAILLGFGLSMDAFAVSISKGTQYQKISVKVILLCALWFGLFQGIMPLVGYLLASVFIQWIDKVDHFIAFILLLGLGIKMIIDSTKKEEDKKDPSVSFKVMIILAIATSIDALAAGVSMITFDSFHAYMSILFTGVITFVVSGVGVIIGTIFGSKFKRWAEMAGGIILILIGVKILLEHLL